MTYNVSGGTLTLAQLQLLCVIVGGNGTQHGDEIRQSYLETAGHAS